MNVRHCTVRIFAVLVVLDVPRAEEAANSPPRVSITLGHCHIAVAESCGRTSCSQVDDLYFCRVELGRHLDRFNV